MTNENLAGYANLSLYSAMAVLTVAMVCHAIYLAALLPARDRLRDDLTPAVADREAELVAAGAGPGRTQSPVAPTRHTGGELSRRALTAAGIASTTTWLGGFLLLLSVVLRGLAVHRWPLGNMFEFAVMGSMFTVLAYSIWSTRRELRWLGVFITGPVLLVLGMAVAVWYTEAAELMPSLRSYWLVIHVTVATLATAVFTIGAALSLVYLLKDAFERSGRATVLDRFPETPAIERTAYSLHIVAFPLWTFTLIAGAIWARQAWASYWNWDPKEVWTFVIWVVYAAYLHSRATSGISRQTVSYIALAGYACIIVNFAVVNVFFVGQHSYSGL
ncbi:cytochrome c-type biogenesis protein CcsB [Phycicoccus badiiscoriae]|uniref:Cytochrome c-type biogenesis protein CcsB n=1 Tax=Pedococcus badiiscoriae TaxID=642776 RepID=A0A852WBN0_9MICO|nr:c-type cytochrome biogenesis protein CcsB [Pedococcus badiiscoriae]NYG06468.1 cytochrome c-type biogenesis protein CcsB [Pedococcus badiiscoriae]